MSKSRGRRVYGAALVTELVALVGFFLPWKRGDDGLATELFRYLFDEGEALALQLWESQSALFPLAFVVPMVACIVTAVVIGAILISGRPAREAALSASLMSCVVIAGPATFFRLTGPLYDSFDAWRRLDELDIGWYLALAAALLGSIVIGYGYLREATPHARESVIGAGQAARRQMERSESIALVLVAAAASMSVIGYYAPWASYSLGSTTSDTLIVQDITGGDFTYPMVLIPAIALLSLVFFALCMAVRKSTCPTMRLFGKGSSVLALALALFWWFTWPVFDHFSRRSWLQDPELRWGWGLCVMGLVLMLATLLWTGRIRKGEQQPVTVPKGSERGEGVPSEGLPETG